MSLKRTGGGIWIGSPEPSVPALPVEQSPHRNCPRTDLSLGKIGSRVVTSIRPKPLLPIALTSSRLSIHPLQIFRRRRGSPRTGIQEGHTAGLLRPGIRDLRAKRVCPGRKTGKAEPQSLTVAQCVLLSVIPKSVRIFGFFSSIDRMLWQAPQSCVMDSPPFALCPPS